MQRIFITIAGLFGAAGVGLAAAGSHMADANFSIAANFLLIHAAVLIGLGALPRTRLGRATGLVLALGVALFAGDLVVKSSTGASLFPMAAPIGGGTMILGWVLVIVRGITISTSSRPAP